MNILSERPPETSAALAALSRALFRLTGWRAEGCLPNLPKFIVVSAPHTSNWDGIILVLAAETRVRPQNGGLASGGDDSGHA